MVGIIEENNENNNNNNNTIFNKLQENLEVIKLNKTCEETMINNNDDEKKIENEMIMMKTDDENDIYETVKTLLNDVLNLVENLINNSENCVVNNLEENDEEKPIKNKGILKHKRTYSNKRVNFDEDIEYIRAYDPKKDYTAEIQFVDKLTKRIVSYAALFAQRKAEEENAARMKAENVAVDEKHDGNEDDNDDDDENLENELLNKFKNVKVK